MQMSSRTIPNPFHFLKLTAARSSLLREHLTGLKSFVLQTSLEGNIQATIIIIAQPFKLYTRAGFSTRCLLVLGSYSILYNHRQHRARNDVVLGFTLICPDTRHRLSHPCVTNIFLFMVTKQMLVCLEIRQITKVRWNYQATRLQIG